jgi:hypothetical protein
MWTSADSGLEWGYICTPYNFFTPCMSKSSIRWTCVSLGNKEKKPLGFSVLRVNNKSVVLGWSSVISSPHACQNRRLGELVPSSETKKRNRQVFLPYELRINVSHPCPVMMIITKLEMERILFELVRPMAGIWDPYYTQIWSILFQLFTKRLKPCLLLSYFRACPL